MFRYGVVLVSQYVPGEAVVEMVRRGAELVVVRRRVPGARAGVGAVAAADAQVLGRRRVLVPAQLQPHLQRRQHLRRDAAMVHQRQVAVLQRRLQACVS